MIIWMLYTNSITDTHTHTPSKYHVDHIFAHASTEVHKTFKYVRY